MGYTNDLGIEGQDLLLRMIPVTPSIAFALFQEKKSFPSGVLDVGYVYDLKFKTKYLTVC